jgi:hypothetical protein
MPLRFAWGMNIVQSRSVHAPRLYGTVAGFLAVSWAWPQSPVTDSVALPADFISPVMPEDVNPARGGPYGATLEGRKGVAGLSQLGDPQAEGQREAFAGAEEDGEDSLGLKLGVSWPRRQRTRSIPTSPRTRR